MFTYEPPNTRAHPGDPGQHPAHGPAPAGPARRCACWARCEAKASQARPGPYPESTIGPAPPGGVRTGRAGTRRAAVERPRHAVQLLDNGVVAVAEVPPATKVPKRVMSEVP